MHGLGNNFHVEYRSWILLQQLVWPMIVLQHRLMVMQTIVLYDMTNIVNILWIKHNWSHGKDSILCQNKFRYPQYLTPILHLLSPIVLPTFNFTWNFIAVLILILQIALLCFIMLAFAIILAIILWPSLKASHVVAMLLWLIPTLLV